MYTKFELEIFCGHDGVTDHEENISEIAGYFDCFSSPIKWQKYEEDMLYYSKLYPKVIFKLSGKSQNIDEPVWEKFYYKGKLKIGGFKKMKMCPKCKNVIQSHEIVCNNCNEVVFKNLKFVN